MSKASLADLLVGILEQDIVNVQGELVHVALHPVVGERPTLRVDIVVESGPVDFRMLRALRPRQRATKAQKYSGVGEFATQPPHPKGLRGTIVSSPGGLRRDKARSSLKSGDGRSPCPHGNRHRR